MSKEKFVRREKPNLQVTTISQVDHGGRLTFDTVMQAARMGKAQDVECLIPLVNFNFNRRLFYNALNDRNLSQDVRSCFARHIAKNISSSFGFFKAKYPELPKDIIHVIGNYHTELLINPSY